MVRGKVPTVALALVVVALAGCTGGDDALAIKVTSSDDPINEPFIFEATGGADRFVWDFNDGTGTHEGKRVEHTFGFSDGTVTVRVTAHRGDARETARTDVTLGSGQNQNPAPLMQTTSDWVTPGTPLRISGAASTDADGDPLLFRWDCENLGQPVIAHGHEHSDSGGLPFGVNTVATVTSGVPAADRTIDGDLCDAFTDGSFGAFTRDGTIEGSFADTGVYRIHVEIRDPKSPTFIGRADIYVTGSVPPPVLNETFNGTLLGGAGGGVQDVGDEAGLGEEFDKAVRSFRVDVPNKQATIRFSHSSQAQVAPDIEWSLKSGGSNVIAPTNEASATIGPNTLRNNIQYDVHIDLASGALVEWSWSIEVVQDLRPVHLYEIPQ